MKIIKLKQNGKYCNLEFDNGISCKILAEISYHFSLTEGDVLSSDKLNLINSENTDKMCLNSALDLLSRRIHSEYELKIKLNKKYRYSNISKVIEECRRLDLLDDDYFAQCYIQELTSKGKGKYQIISSMKSRGISKDIFEKYVDKYTKTDDEMERAKVIALRKILSYKNYPNDKIKEKLTRHLLSKGYSYEIVKETVYSIIEEIDG